MALLSCSRCQRCGAATRFFLVNLQEAVLMCSMQEVRRALRRPETTSQPLTHFCFFGIHFLSASQCVWPLDVVGEIDEVCLPASDPRVKSFTAAVAAHEPELPPPAAQQQVSSSSDELQHISNMLFQPSPACSPAVHGAPYYRLPTGDSLPASTTSSTLLGPSATGLPPAFELSDASPPAGAPPAATPVASPAAFVPPRARAARAGGDATSLELPPPPLPPIHGSTPPEPPRSSGRPAAANPAAQQPSQGRSLADLISGGRTKRGRGFL